MFFNKYHVIHTERNLREGYIYFNTTNSQVPDFFIFFSIIYKFGNRTGLIIFSFYDSDFWIRHLLEAKLDDILRAENIYFNK